MERPLEDIRFLIKEAAKDEEWFEKLKTAKSTEEYIMLLSKKEIELPKEYKDELSKISIENKEIPLSDEELDQTVGGYFPIFDECRESWNYGICVIGRWLNGRCIHCESDFGVYKGYVYEFFSCNKGYFSNMKVKK
ncbi:hypothetical protein [Petroclostridium sp. X23]|uniref:hypothetical protein n=1 Tax=Petroclostridium sp. X23 TaxID=3045146 RepID=UPI0024ADC2D8|nr:hypothetical protein [Petroclostridium sp. X23]WHH60801.1 hypothetical protein QKW49_08920 [Petroclostridium sp. X23]